MNLKFDKINLPSFLLHEWLFILRVCILFMLIQFMLPLYVYGDEEVTDNDPAGKSEQIIDDPLIRAKAAIEDGLYGLGSRILSRQIIEGELVDNKAKKAVSLLLRCLYNLGEYESIIEKLESKEFGTHVKDTDSEEFWRAMANYELANYEICLSSLDGYEKNFPDSDYKAQAARLRAWCIMKQGKVDEAVEVFESYIARFKDDRNYSLNLLEWSRALIDINRSAEAKKTLQHISGDLSEAYIEGERAYLMSKLLLEEGAIEKASGLLAQVSTNSVLSRDLRARACFSIALISEIQDNKKQAEEALREGNRLAKSSDLKRRGHYELGSLLLRMNRLDDAIPLLSAYISAYPDEKASEVMQLKLAQALGSNYRHEEAVSEFGKYIETFTNTLGQARAYEGKGWSLMELERYGEAATAFEKGYSLYPDQEDQARCLFKKSDAHFANEQYALAGDGYFKFIEEFPKNEFIPDVRFQLAESLSRKGEIAKAEEMFDLIVQDYPDHRVAAETLLRLPELKLRMAREAEREGLRDESAKGYYKAIEGFEKFMEIYTNSPLYAVALHGRGVARYRLFWFKQALSDFNRVINDFDDQEIAEQSFYMRGMCLYGMVQDDKALKIWHDFIDRYPESEHAPEVLFWAAKSEYNRSYYKVAEKDFLLLAEKYPDSWLADESFLWAARAAAGQKEFVRANEILTDLIRKYPNSDKLAEARFDQADALSELGKFEDAILIFDQIIKKFPESDLVPLAWGRKGDCQFTLGVKDSKYYKASIDSFRAVVNNPKAGRELILQAEYKIGRSMEKQGLEQEALDQYYIKVILSYLEDREKGVWHNESSKLWFSRGVFNSVDILERMKKWRQAVSILERVVSAGMPTAEESKERIKAIKSEHLWLF